MIADDYDKLSFINSEDLEEWMSETKRAYEFLPSQYYPKFLSSDPFQAEEATIVDTMRRGLSQHLATVLVKSQCDSGCVGEFDSQTNIFKPLWRVKGKRVANGTPAIERAMAKAHQNDSEFRDAFNAEEPEKVRQLREMHDIKIKDSEPLNIQPGAIIHDDGFTIKMEATPVSLGMAYDKIKEAMGIIGSLISSQASAPQKVTEETMLISAVAKHLHDAGLCYDYNGCCRPESQSITCPECWTKSLKGEI